MWLNHIITFISRCSQVFYSIHILKNFAKVTRKHQWRSSFLRKLQTTSLRVFLGILRKLWRYLKMLIFLHQSWLHATFKAVFRALSNTENFRKFWKVSRQIFDRVLNVPMTFRNLLSSLLTNSAFISLNFKKVHGE